MKRVLLLLLVSSSICQAWPRVMMPAYREVEIRDVREQQEREENYRLREENYRLARNANRYERVNVVYVNPNAACEPRFDWLTNSDKNMLKYAAFGAIICWLILR